MQALKACAYLSVSGTPAAPHQACICKGSPYVTKREEWFARQRRHTRTHRVKIEKIHCQQLKHAQEKRKHGKREARAKASKRGTDEDGTVHEVGPRDDVKQKGKEEQREGCGLCARDTTSPPSHKTIFSTKKRHRGELRGTYRS